MDESKGTDQATTHFGNSSCLSLWNEDTVSPTNQESVLQSKIVMPMIQCVCFVCHCVCVCVEGGMDGVSGLVRGG